MQYLFSFMVFLNSLYFSLSKQSLKKREIDTIQFKYSLKTLFCSLSFNKQKTSLKKSKN